MAIRRQEQNPRARAGQSRRQRLLKIYLCLALFLLIAAGLAYLFVYSPVFRIEKIVMSGSHDPEVLNQVQLVIKRQLAGYQFSVWPRRNMLLIDLAELQSTVQSDLSLDYLKIEKKYLHTLKVEAREKVPALLWRAGDEYYYLDKEGQALAAVKFENIRFDLPLVSRGTTTAVQLNAPVLAPDEVGFISAVAAKFKASFENLNIRQIIARQMHNQEIFFYTNEGWYFILKVGAAIDLPLENLKLLLADKLKDRAGLEYIDLRIEDKIFYK